ncbi:UDP-glucuronate 4-epimerase 3 [Morus notabilis]|uniref:UDP-glucuronate 4-epimerase 3 n=1 Tax=Morus notabilis TaxID=981085 RepID=W9SD88_9ROSA|nr:UDP-glucuronate 4-epimerase 3 [Morus notabilis]
MASSGYGGDIPIDAQFNIEEGKFPTNVFQTQESQTTERAAEETANPSPGGRTKGRGRNGGGRGGEASRSASASVASSKKKSSVRYAMQNPSSYVHSNIAGFVNLLEVCKSANPQPAIVWASLSSVYGLNSKVPFSERDRTDQPASLYAATKKAGEEIARTYNHIHGLSITGLMFFTVYGPWGRPDMAYFSFRLFGGFGHGEEKHWEWREEERNAQLRVFNLGNTSPVPVTQLVRILEKLLKVKAKTKVLPLPRNGDVKFTHANISLAYRELGYKPTTDLETGLKKFVRWYLNYYQNSKKSSW